MKLSKIQIIWTLLFLGMFLVSNNAIAQQDKEVKKKIVIVKKTIDKDGNEWVEKIVKEGEDAEDFDVDKFLKENKSEKDKEVDVEVMISDVEDGRQERTVEVTVDGDDVIINENGEKTVVKIDGDSESQEITTEDGKHIIIMTKEGGDVGELLEEMNVTVGADGKKEIRIMKTERKSGAFFGVMIDPSEEGMELLDVVKDSPAEKAGMKKGDIIKTVNEHKISTYKELTTALSKYKPGETIVVTFKRNGMLNKAAAVLADAKDVPMEEKMIWKTDDRKEIKIEGGKEIHIEEEHENGKKKIKKRIIIKKDN